MKQRYAHLSIRGSVSYQVLESVPTFWILTKPFWLNYTCSLHLRIRYQYMKWLSQYKKWVGLALSFFLYNYFPPFSITDSFAVLLLLLYLLSIFTLSLTVFVPCSNLALQNLAYFVMQFSKPTKWWLYRVTHKRWCLRYCCEFCRNQKKQRLRSCWNCLKDVMMINLKHFVKHWMSRGIKELLHDIFRSIVYVVLC